MNIETITKQGIKVAVINNSEPIIMDCQSALDLVMTVKYETGCKNIAINKEAIVNEFFILSTGLAGEILQKFINYGVRIAVYGDFTCYTSKPLHDFIYESNHGNDVFFQVSKEDAINKLCNQK